MNGQFDFINEVVFSFNSYVSHEMKYTQMNPPLFFLVKAIYLSFLPHVGTIQFGQDQITICLITQFRLCTHQTLLLFTAIKFVFPFPILDERENTKSESFREK